MTKGVVWEETGQKWSVHRDGLGDSGFRTQIPDLPLSTCRRVGRLFILPEPLFCLIKQMSKHTHQRDVIRSVENKYKLWQSGWSAYICLQLGDHFALFPCLSPRRIHTCNLLCHSQPLRGFSAVQEGLAVPATRSLQRNQRTREA